MKHQLIKSFTCKLFLALALTPSIQAFATEMPTEEENRTIVTLKDAFREGNFQEFVRLSAKIPSDSLFSPYADAWLFRLIQHNDTDESTEKVWPQHEIRAILNKHNNTWAAEQLRRTWLQQLARSDKWETYNEERPKLRYRPDFGVECADMLNSASQGQLVREKIRTVTTYDDRLPKTCRFLIRKLYDRKALSDEDLNTRLYHLIAHREINNAQKFINEYNDASWGQGIPQSILTQATDNPSRYLKEVESGKLVDDTSITAAITRIAAKDYKKALRLLNESYAKKLNSHSRQWLWGYVAYRAALNWDPLADEYFDNADQKLFSHEHFEWQMRAALLNNNMIKVIQLSNQLPKELKEDETWQFWKARAMAEQGDLVNAKRTLVQFANPFTFYGKLALEELGSNITPLLHSKAVSALELRQAKQNKGLVRALAFYDAGLRYEGFREFNLQTEQMTDRELIAAATWAKNNQLFDRAIAAADRTKKEHDLNLRYLMLFKKNMIAKAQKTRIDPAWAYGIIRQESRFITVARSHVGASGLMQVMPATAKYVAKKIGLKDFTPKQVNNIDTNLTLGTSYLRIISEGLENSQVLASAGYNAGPSRPRSWRSRLGANRTVDGALFAELIPFDETRNYVKHVMSNTAVYSMLITGKPISLKQRLGMIRGTD